MTTSSASFDWIREIKPEIKALDTIPLTGGTPPFPWDKISNYLSQSFEREIKFEPKTIEWRTKDQLYEGLGGHAFPLNLSVPSLRGNLCWVMPQQDMVILESLLLTKESHPLTFQDKDLIESFYRFCALEFLYALTQTDFDKTIIPILTDQTHLPREDSLCFDVALHVEQQVLWGRLIISPEFRRSWVEHFTQQRPFTVSKEIAEKVDVIVHLGIGKTQLTSHEWSAISLGDFILLEQCSLDKEDLNGRVMLTINGKNVYRAKLKDGNLKILETPLYHEADPLPAQQEVPSPMAKQPDEDFSDFDDLEDIHDDSDLHLTDDDPFADTDLDEDFLTESHEEAGSEPSPSPTPQTPPAQSGTQEEKQSGDKVGLLSLDQIPISLVVEVGRVQMTMQKLLELEPGNLLELNIRPEDGVDLVINGKRVGRGELIRIGESLGVRILDLGR